MRSNRRNFTKWLMAASALMTIPTPEPIKIIGWGFDTKALRGHWKIVDYNKNTKCATVEFVND